MKGKMKANIDMVYFLEAASAVKRMYICTRIMGIS